MVRRILWALLVLAPIALLGRYVFSLGETALFILSALALIPLAWLIGEATEHAAEHTGPGVGGFLNASFGNAPELIIALLAVADNLPGVVRGSLTGSVVSNILLVLGAAMIAGGDGPVDTRSLRWQLAAVFGAVVLLLIPSIPAWNSGSSDRHSLYLLSLPVSVVLLCAYLIITVRNLRIHRAAAARRAQRRRLVAQAIDRLLSGGNIVTAFVSEILVHSLDHFGHAVGLNQFFIAVVIVAIVGNAAEHGGAVVIAHRGNTTLATEIAITSSMQVARLRDAGRLPALVHRRPRPAALVPGDRDPDDGRRGRVRDPRDLDGRSRRWEGFLLVGVYGLAVVAYALV